MAEKPIIFSAPMIRALLDGRKSQTRRVLKPPYGTLEYLPDGTWKPIFTRAFPGDRLWVRETWAQHHPAGVQEGRFSIMGQAGIPGPPPVEYRVIYRADGDPVRVWHCRGYPYRTTEGPRDEIDAKHPDVCSEFPGWSPSIHMPRWASRLTLTVTDVRVQRVQDISPADSMAEGVECQTCAAMAQSACNGKGCFASVCDFRNLWDSLNAKRGYGWDENPWVCALTFTVHRCNIDQMEGPL